MKVWFPTPATQTGSQVFTNQLACALSKRGIETVITTYPKYIEAMPWLLSNYKPPERSNLVHLGSGSAAGFFHHGIPSVITAHGAFERPDYDQYKSFAQKQYHSLLIRPNIKNAVAEASIVTAVSSWVANIYQRDYAADKISVINNWVDTNVFSPMQKPMTRKLLFVGRTAWQKGSQLLPELSEILGSDFELTCTLLEHEWTGQVPRNVSLIGPVARNKMIDLYRSHDALVVPSLAEGFCLAAAEAMACGLPVFGFRGHGLDDVIGPMMDSCTTGMLDVKGLAERIRSVFDQQQIYRNISEQSQLRVRSCFTEQIALTKYISIYEKIAL